MIECDVINRQQLVLSSVDEDRHATLSEVDKREKIYGVTRADD